MPADPHLNADRFKIRAISMNALTDKEARPAGATYSSSAERLRPVNKAPPIGPLMGTQRALREAGFPGGTHGKNGDGIDGQFGKDTIDSLKAAMGSIGDEASEISRKISDSFNVKREHLHEFKAEMNKIIARLNPDGNPQTNNEKFLDGLRKMKSEWFNNQEPAPRRANTLSAPSLST